MLVAKSLVWLAWALFTAYTVYATRRENFFKSLRTMLSLHWGRQVGLDLYLGLAMSLGVIYLHEQSVVALMLWGVPVLLLGNLVTLLYLALHFEQLVAHF